MTSTNDAAIEAAVLDSGIVRCLSYQVEQQIASGALVRLLPSCEPEEQPVHILHREGGQFETPKVRAFISMLETNLKNALSFIHPSL